MEYYKLFWAKINLFNRTTHLSTSVVVLLQSLQFFIFVALCRIFLVTLYAAWKKHTKLGNFFKCFLFSIMLKSTSNKHIFPSKEWTGANIPIVCLWFNGSLDQSLIVDSLNYFSFQPVLHNGCNKECGIYFLWDDTYKVSRAFSLACWVISLTMAYFANKTKYHFKESTENWKCKQPMWRQRGSFLTVRMVLNHMSDAI